MRTSFLGLWVASLCALAQAGCSSEADEHDADAGNAASAGMGGSGTGGGASGGTGGSGADAASDRFSFFVTSFAALQRLSGNANGFGGDLRYGEADGLSGADKICTEIAESSMPGSGAKGWRAFLSAVRGKDGAPVHAIDRIGEGPWYDRLGRVVGSDKASLMGFRPQAADPLIVDDLPNEDGVPNHSPAGTPVDNHDTLTGSSSTGQLFAMDSDVTCEDWTTSEPIGRPRVGHSWPRFAGGTFPGFPGGGAGSFPSFGDGGLPPFPGGGMTDGGTDQSCFLSFEPGGGGFGDYGHWMSSLSEAGCAPVVYLIDDILGMDCNTRGVGSGGGYGGFYCFALMP